MIEVLGQLATARIEGGVYLLPEGIRLRLTGRDAFRYLNGQITRDLNRVDTGKTLGACLLTPKGKLCAVVSILRDGEDLIVETEAGVGEALKERLERYLVADDVEILPEAWFPRWHRFGEAMTSSADFRGIGSERLGVPGEDLPVEELTGVIPLDPSVVEILRIERGIPVWGRELSGEILPPEAGLDRTHIDYDRGCYPGQEVISRLKSIGRVSRLLHGFSGRGLERGSPILSEEGKILGTLTSVAELPQGGGSIALGYLPRQTSGQLHAEHPLTGERRPLSITGTYGT